MYQVLVKLSVISTGSSGAWTKSQVTKVALCALVKSPWVEGGQ